MLCGYRYIWELGVLKPIGEGDCRSRGKPVSGPVSPHILFELLFAPGNYWYYFFHKEHEHRSLHLVNSRIEALILYSGNTFEK